jgi:hypothetical protein
VGKKERNTHREIEEIEVKGGDTERSGVSGREHREIGSEREGTQRDRE